MLPHLLELELELDKNILFRQKVNSCPTKHMTFHKSRKSVRNRFFVNFKLYHCIVNTSWRLFTIVTASALSWTVCPIYNYNEVISVE